MKFRDGVSFSDGTPLTVSGRRLHLSGALRPEGRQPGGVRGQIAGKPLTVRALDDHTVVLMFPGAVRSGARLFYDSLPILPRHKLAAA